MLEIDIGMIVVAAGVNVALGMLWYSKNMFGPRWIKLVGIKKTDKPTDMQLSYSLTFFAALVMAFTLEIFIESSMATSVLSGAMMGFWAGVGFVATSSLPGYLFNPRAKSKEVYLIDASYYIVTLMVMGFLLAL